MAQHNHSTETRASIFGDIAETPVWERLPRLKIGDYLLLVTELGGFVSHTKNRIALFKFKVVESTAVGDSIPSDKKEEIAFAWDLSDDKYGYKKGEVKKCLAALLKSDHKELTQKDVDLCIDPVKQPLKHALVRCRVAHGDKANPKTPGFGYVESRFYPDSATDTPTK